MNRYVCLLRGINVSGKNKIVMKELVAMFEDLGFRNVESYIQSGNISFDSKEADKAQLEEAISNGIRERFGLEVKSFVRTKKQIHEILDRCPYPIHELKENEQLHFSLLESSRENNDIPLEIKTKTTDECFILEDTVYILCHNGYGNTLLSNTFFEKKLKTTATTRNLATMRKLSE